MVPRHMGINANEAAYVLRRQGFSHPLRGPNPMLGTPEKFVGGGSGTEEVGNMKSIDSTYVDKGKLRGFSKKPSKTSWGIAQPDHKPAKNIDTVANRTLSFKRTHI
jgi:hypothetical protein